MYSNCINKWRVTLLCSSFISLLAVGNCPAQDGMRKGTSELYGIGGYVHGDDFSGSVEGVPVSAQIDGHALYGFGLGHNFDDHFNLNTNLLWGSADVDGRAPGVDVSGDADVFTWNVNLDYNVFKNAFTPVLSGGIGLINLDGDINGVKFDETDFAYNLGAGVRWDAENSFFVKAMYTWTWTELEDTDDSILLDGFFLAVGVRF